MSVSTCRLKSYLASGAVGAPEALFFVVVMAIDAFSKFFCIIYVGCKRNILRC